MTYIGKEHRCFHISEPRLPFTALHCSHAHLHVSAWSGTRLALNVSVPQHTNATTRPFHAHPHAAEECWEACTPVNVHVRVGMPCMGFAGRLGKQGAASPVTHDATSLEQSPAQHPPGRTAGERAAALARRPENTGAAGPVPGTMQASSSVVALLSSADSGASPETSPTTGYSTNPTSAAGQGNTMVYMVHDIALCL